MSRMHRLPALLLLVALGCGRAPESPTEVAAPLSGSLTEALGAPGLHLAVEREAREARLVFAPAGGGFEFRRDATPSDSRPGPGFRVEVGSDGVMYVKRSESEAGVRLRPTRGPLVPGAPRLRDGAVLFPAGGDGVLLRVRPNGVKEDIVLSGPRGAALEFEWQLELDEGLEAGIDAHGNVDIYGPENYLWSNIQIADDTSADLVQKARRSAKKTQLLYRIPAPVVRDATGTVGGRARFELRAGRLRLVAAQLERLSYPITVDPSVIVTSTQDFGLGGNFDSNGYLGSGLIYRAWTQMGVNTWTATAGLPTVRYAHAAVAYNGHLYVVGGYGGSPAAYLADVQVATINASDGSVGAWSATTSLPAGRGFHAIAAYNGQLYVAGGWVSGMRSDVMRAPIQADGTIGSWVTTTSFTTGRYDHAVVAYAGFFYVIGGYGGSNLADVQVAAINATGDLGAFTTTTALATGRTRLGAAALNGSVYVVGGVTTAEPGGTASVVRASVGAGGLLGAWVACAGLPSVMSKPGVTIHAGYLYAIGGYSASYTAATYTAAISPTGDLADWRTTGSLPSGRDYAAAAAWNGKIYVAGGRTGSSVYTNEVYFGALDSGGTMEPAWSTESSLPGGTTRYGHTLTAYGGYLWLVGGFDGTSFLTTVLSAPLNADGSVGTWTTQANTLATGRMRHATVVYNGYLYVIGGQTSGSYLADVQKAYISSSGAIGAFSTAGTFTTGRRQHAAVAWAGYLYVLGGQDYSQNVLGDVQYAPFLTDGTANLGTFSTTTALPSTRMAHGAVAVNGYLYLIGGQVTTSTSTRTAAVNYIAFTASGPLGASWGTTSSLPEARNSFGVYVHNGYLYVVGGRVQDPSPYYTDTVAMAQFYYSGVGLRAFVTLDTRIPTARQEFQVAVNDGQMYMVAGLAATGALGDARRIHLNTGGTLSNFQTTTVLPGGTRGHGSVGYQGSVYVVGGYSGSAYKNQVYRSIINPTSGLVSSWQSLASLPANSMDHGTAVLNGYIYVVGGYNGAAKDTTYYASVKSDGTLNPWTTSSVTFGVARYGLAAIATRAPNGNSYLYAIGGYASGYGTLADVFMAQINPADGSIGTWTTTNALPAGRRYHTLAIAGGYLYLFGGYSPAGYATGDVWSAYINSDGTLGTWTDATSLPENVVYHAMAYEDGYTYVVGNYAGVPYVLTAPLFNGGRVGNWTFTQSTAANRWGAGAAIAGGRLYVTGGGQGSTAITAVEVADLQTPASIGEYTKPVDLGGVMLLDSLVWTGNPNAQGLMWVSLRTAGADGVFGSDIDLGTIPTGAVVPLGLNGVRTAFVEFALDDRLSGTVTDGANNQRNLYDFTLNFTDRCAGIVCPTPDQCHVLGTCDPVTGLCSNPPTSDGTPCSDGNACSQTDTCQAGVCTGSNWVVCQALGQCYDVGTCSTTTGVCSNPYKPSTASCDDGRSCSVNDHCDGSGNCIADTSGCGCTTNADCTPLDDCHDQGTCNSGTGVCTYPPKANGTGCNDHNACSQTDTCQGGVCTGSNWVTCSASDQCHDVGTCNPLNGVCSNPAKANGTGCSDGNACSQTDTCQGGVCTGSNWVTCSASDQCHDVGTCNTTTGVCSNPNKADGTVCNDGNACTQTDRCVSGVCQGTNPVVCVAQDQCHDVGTCNTSSGVCSNPVKANGSGCDDGNACTRTDTCQNGSCIGGNLVTCTAQDQCHDVGTCDTTTGACSNPAKSDGTTCNDNNACTTGETCQGGVCGSPTSTVQCSASDQCHDVGTCSPSTGQCSNPPKANNTPCDDGKTCTTGDACQSGVCTPAVNNCQCFSDNDCTPLDQCHDAGTCNLSTNVCSTPKKGDGTTCDDGNACTQTDSCQNGTCVGTNPKTCVASDQCHDVGTCDPGSGSCSNPPKTDGTTCDDTDKCTLVDTCIAGVCVGGQPKQCADDQCRFGGTCNPTTGQCDGTPKPDGTACNDGNKCTQNDMCTSGTCAGTPVTCTPLDSCHTAGTCTAATGLCTNPPKQNGAACDDGNACTSGETCTNGVCGSPTSTVTCTALDQCHEAGACDTTTGVCTDPIRPNGTACNDGESCTSGDTCQAGVCSPSTVDCSCNASGDCPAAGQCQITVICNASHKCEYVNKADGTACDDGDACTTGETCQGGVCGAPTTTVLCSALDQCHAAGACDPATGVCTNPIKADGTTCDDGRACTTGDACQSGVCVPETNDCVCTQDADCPPPSQCYDQGTCNLGTSRCVDAPKADGTPCDDGNACTSGETCQGGLCSAPTTVVSCTALDQCHGAGVCDVATGRCPDPLLADGTTCDDGDACTTGDECQGGLCVGGSPSCQDAGTDSGTDGGVATDGPTADGAVQEDAGTQADAGVQADASPQVDAATGDGPKQEVKSYLSCAAAGGRSAAPGLLALLLLGLAGLRRRR